ncbi:pyrroline-5-carboxylate reductase [Fictibacillus phosphorivorans]|uniref:Pyrroline-5-carboxylate reductase n=1 Tax=Fictibacillus phosphorivorans TaxID=1221500 RepID=A0A163R1T4_9BACL|nr:pyrroline-5-carboxylate reductase [Fictibacillus phosphorivorans]KZE66065.1 pyrroline-5-carboxylate reductase [Fictibacillus phosphorivorans]
MLKNRNITFIGAGSMAEAMISGLINKAGIPPEQITAANHSNERRRLELNEKYNIQTMAFSEISFNNTDVIILAVKPKQAETVLQQLRPVLQDYHVILSVLAGISTRYIEEILEKALPIIRVMPNTSSMIGESITGISAGKYVKNDDLDLAQELSKAIGKVKIISEKQMDVFTGIAGSGPAYFYYLLEHIEDIAVENGLDRELARDIAAQTLYGASKMVMESEDSPAELRKKVTSPNGTTAAGLEALAENGGGIAIERAVVNAAKRSKTLRKEFEKVPAL